jgi:molybdenum cofactor cytidylyltransferase
MTPDRVIAIVLAAGESRRMGTLKPLLAYGSGSVIQAVVRSLQASPVDRVRVVLGHRSAEIGAHLAAEGVETVENPRYPEGMLTSVQAALAAGPPDTEWWVIALGDQPALQPGVVRMLLDAVREARQVRGATLCIPAYDGRRGHPLVIHGSHREEILALAPEGGLRALMQAHPEAIRHVEVPTDTVLHDMDTPEDYARELARREQQGRG